MKTYQVPQTEASVIDILCSLMTGSGSEEGENIQGNPSGGNKPTPITGL